MRRIFSRLALAAALILFGARADAQFNTNFTTTGAAPSTCSMKIASGAIPLKIASGALPLKLPATCF